MSGLAGLVPVAFDRASRYLNPVWNSVPSRYR